MFNINMSTKGAMDSSSLLALNGGQGSQNNNQPMNQPMGQPMNQSQPMGQPMNQPMGQPMGQPMNQSQPMGQPMGQPMNQSQPMGQPMNQPMGQPMNQPMGQPMNQPMGQPMNQSQPMGQPMNRPAGNGVHLKKGQKFALAGVGGAQLSTIQVCLGWDIKNQECDLDASAFMLDANNKVVGDDWFVFYGQTSSPDSSVVHSGDSGGEGMGDDEVITVNLPGVNPAVQKITFVVTINEALEKGLNFSMVANAYVRVVDKSNGKEIARFDLTDYYANVTSMVVGELYRYNGSWKFNAVGDGVAKDLYGLCTMYGVNIAD